MKLEKIDYDPSVLCFVVGCREPARYGIGEVRGLRFCRSHARELGDINVHHHDFIICEADAIGNFFVLWNRDFITLPVGGRLLEIFTREQAEKIVDLLEELS